MKLCTALGWKGCHVSLHYNLDALEITHAEHTADKKTEFREEMQAEQTADLLSSKPFGSLLPLQTLLDRHAELGHESV